VGNKHPSRDCHITTHNTRRCFKRLHTGRTKGPERGTLARIPAIKGKFYADQMFSKLNSVHGHIGATIYTNGLRYDRIYPWKQKGDHHETIMDLIHDVGVPQTLVTDKAPEKTMG
jgi:hypothetical protein